MRELINRELCEVNSKYGAPMGRWEYREIQPIEKSLYCFEVSINNGGYDQGGAYWGVGYGSRLYCIVQPDYETCSPYGRRYFRVFIRAINRNAAIDKSGFALYMFKRPSTFVADKRFTCTREYYGEREPGFVLRFCGEWVDVFSDIESARKGALSHARNWVRS